MKKMQKAKTPTANQKLRDLPDLSFDAGSRFSWRVIRDAVSCRVMNWFPGGTNGVGVWGMARCEWACSHYG